MQRLGGRLLEVVAYESRTTRAKFLSRPGMELYTYSQKNNESLLPLSSNWKFY